MRASAITGVAAAVTALGRRAVRLRLGHQDRIVQQLEHRELEGRQVVHVDKKPTRRRRRPRDEDARDPTRRSPATSRTTTSPKPRSMRRSRPPTINLPVPEGWEPAGEDTPDWAYGAILYTGPEAAEYTPSIVALVSKLTGNADPQKIIDLAPGELQEPIRVKRDERWRGQHPG